MQKYIKTYINQQMEKDYKECADLYNNGIEKECETCSCNGGENIGCIMECEICKEVDQIAINDIATYYGYDKQSRQCIEECSELIQAINKFWRKFLECGERTSFDYTDMVNSHEYTNLVEEIADVQVTLEQMKILLKCKNEVIQVAEAKVKRQLDRIKCK